MSVISFVFLFALAGAVVGALMARRRGGNRLDMAQWAGSLAIICALIGLFTGIIIMRTMA